MRAPARKPCLDCGTIGYHLAGSRCDDCTSARQRRRDRAPSRRTLKQKYGPTHRAERKAWYPLVVRGVVKCWRCERPILPGDDWHLGHRDGHPSHPEHAWCNLRASNENRR